MKYVIMARPDPDYFMIAVKANHNRKIKDFKLQGYQIVGRMRNETLISKGSLTIYAQ